MQSSLDDLPVGGGGGSNQPDEFASNANSIQQSTDNSGPLEQRIVSKNWLIRANAFDELTNIFKAADNQHSQEFKDHAGSWKKYLADANPGSLEKCLDALEVFINRADPKIVASCQNDVIKILIDKCVGHAKPTIKTKSLECFNLLFEVSEAFDDSIETICESLNSKNVKISTCTLVVLNSWLSNYGVKKIKIKSFLPIVEVLASQTNPGVRTEAMSFYKECYKFLGDALKPLIQGLKKQQLDELDKEFLIIKDQPKPQLRLTRKEKEKLKDAAIDDLIKQDEEENKVIDAYDLVDGVDLMAKFGNEWQDKILEAKAWKEKKEMLDDLINDSNVPKIKTGDFSGLAKVLKKLIGDSNIVVSQNSVKACGNLAKGLRKDFEPCCKEILPALIAKFREKKTQVIEDTNAVMSNLLMCTNLEFMLQEILAGLIDKSPLVKKYVCHFIEKAAQETYIDVLQRISGEILQSLVKATDDPQAEVRDAALSTLGILKGRLGEAALSKYLTDLNPQKLQKVNESAQIVKPSKYDKPDKSEKAPEPPAKSGPPKKQANPAVQKTAPKKQEELIDDQIVGGNSNKNAFDEQPIGGGSKPQNEFDEQPIGGGNKKPAMTFDEEPIGGNKNKPMSFEDQPIGGNKNKGMTFDDQPIGGGKPSGGFEDQPLPGAKGGFNANDPLAEGDEVPIKRGAYNLDNLDDLDPFGTGGNPPPPKKKPIVKKKPVVEEEKKFDNGGDVIMSDETAMPSKKIEERKAPPKAKPSTTAAAKTTAPTKGPSGPNVQEEDVGTGLSKEEAEAKVQETYPSDIVALFEEAKWQDKVNGFKGLGEQVISLQPTQDVIEATVKFIKSKMKDWKESNLNLIKESIAFFLLVSQNCEKINKRAVVCIMPFLCDKIGDVKLVSNISETLLNLSEIVTPKFISLQVIKYCSQAKAPNTIKEGCNVLIKMTDEFGVMNMAIKEMIDYGILAANNTNPQVRTQSMALFALMFKHAGETIKNFLKDIKESTMKLIEEEFAKVTPYKKGEYEQKRNFRGEAAASVKQEGPKKGGTGGGGGGGLAALLDDALPRQDISKLLTPKIMPLFKHADWKQRKAAADSVEEMCRGANMRIQPNGLNELMDNVKQRMADPNKAVLKSYIQLIGILVEALGPAAKQFQKKILPGMLATLADKQSLVRGDAIACMDKWAEHVGPEIIINNVGPMLIQENPELRTEALKWIIKQKDAIKISEMKEYTKALVSCLSDKTPAIRNLAEEVICYVMPNIGFQPFSAVTSDLLPAVQQTIKPVLERIKQKVGTINIPQDQMMGSSGAPQKQAPATQQATTQQQPTLKQQQPPPQPTLKQQTSAKPTLQAKTQGATQQNDNQNKPPQQNLNSSLQPSTNNMNQSLIKKKENQTPAQQKQQQMPQRSESREMIRPKGLSQTITQFKQEEPVQEAVNVNFGFKEKRAEYDRKSKFQLEDIKGDQIERLKQQTSQALGASFQAKMFSNDFKLHVECIEAFNFLIQQQPEALLEILDIIFKWALVKLQDSSNTKFAVGVFDFLNGLFIHLEDTQYNFLDFEALIIFPLLCEKSGINNNILKDKVKKLIKIIYPLYDLKRGYQLIVQYGLNSKNLRAQAECLDELSEYIIRFGVDNCTEKELKLVAKMADNNDKNIRENALKFMGEIYKILDDNIWRAIGDVTPKVQGLLEQRFKKLKVGGAPQMGGNTLAQSTSQSNFGIREQSPKGSKDLKATSNIGLKKSIQQTTEMGKQSATPRSGLQFQKGFAQPKAELSKSINSFNQSNRSNEEQKRTPFQDSRKQQEQNKMPIQESQGLGSKFGQRPIPQTQRPSDTQLNFSQVQRSSEPSSQVTKSSFTQMRQQNIPQVQKQNPQQMFYDDDDDEDLRILTSDDNFGQDPELARAQDEITKHIHQLKYADLSKRVDSLVSLNEMISAIDQNKPVLVRTANDLVSAFTHVLNDIFDKSVEDIPLRFAKYFITIVLKTCSCKEIMKEVSEERIFDLAEQLLTRLLIENLDKVGDNKEGELILKNLNSSMLRLLENCNHTYIFCVLFNLLRKYKDYGLMPKLPNLIIKCLLKLSKILEKLIEKLDMEKILLAIHEYLVVINHDNKTQNDEMGIRIVKTVTNELVKLKRESIWEAYRVIQCHGQADNHIYRWIQIILKSLQTQGSTPGGTQSASSNGDQEIRQLVEELRNPEKFESAIPKLQRFLDQNPQIDLNDYLQECSKTFQQFIKTNLEKHKQSLSKQSNVYVMNIVEENKMMNEYGMQDSMKSTSDSANQQQPQDPVELKLSHQASNQSQQSNRISEYQSKLASMKMRNNQRSGAETTTNRQQPSNLAGNHGNTHNLNTSFSAMNTSLSQKWHEINKKSANTKREGGGTNMQHMSSTMGGFGHQASSNLESRIGMGQNATHQPNNQSIGAASNGDPNMSQGGATNQDLNERLALMKAKLQALKRQ